MNKVILMGRLTRDPDIRYSQAGNNSSYARYTIAVDRPVRRDGNNDDQQTADFIGCVAFSYNAQFAEKYLKKGTKILVEGRIQTGSYTNKDGQRVYTTDVVVERQEFAESRSSSDNSGSASYGGGASGGNANYSNSNSQPAADPGSEFMNIPEGIEEELPFA